MAVHAAQLDCEETPKGESGSSPENMRCKVMLVVWRERAGTPLGNGRKRGEGQ